MQDDKLIAASAAFPTSPVDALTEFVWIVGDPISQVKAPQVMNPHYLAQGRNLLVLPAPVKAENLRGAFDFALRTSNIRGWIVTVPHKVTLCGWIDALSPAARIAGAVNAIRFEGGKSHGDLFDGLGFTTSLKARGFGISRCSALVLGAGGVGSAIALALAEAGAARVDIHDIDLARATSLVERLGNAGTRTVFNVGNPTASSDFDLLVNASPVGMGDDARSPMDTRLLTSRQAVAEVVMTPAMTPLLTAARLAGCQIHPGRQVLDGQLNLLLDFFQPQRLP